MLRNKQEPIINQITLYGILIVLERKGLEKDTLGENMKIDAGEEEPTKK